MSATLPFQLVSSLVFTFVIYGMAGLRNNVAAIWATGTLTTLMSLISVQVRPARPSVPQPPSRPAPAHLHPASAAAACRAVPLRRPALPLERASAPLPRPPTPPLRRPAPTPSPSTPPPHPAPR